MARYTSTTDNELAKRASKNTIIFSNNVKIGGWCILYLFYHGFEIIYMWKEFCVEMFFHGLTWIMFVSMYWNVDISLLQNLSGEWLKGERPNSSISYYTSAFLPKASGTPVVNVECDVMWYHWHHRHANTIKESSSYVFFEKSTTIGYRFDQAGNDFDSNTPYRDLRIRNIFVYYIACLIKLAFGPLEWNHKYINKQTVDDLIRSQLCKCMAIYFRLCPTVLVIIWT